MSSNPELVPLQPGDVTLQYLERTLGVYFIGYIFAMVLYGYTFFQSYMYYSRYPKDFWPIKFTVALLFALDTSVSTVLSQTLYHYLVSLFPYRTTVEVATVPYCAHFVLSVISVYVAQMFYAFSVWHASRNALASGAAAMLSTAALVLGAIESTHLFQDREIANLTNVKAVSGTGIGLAALAAIITFSMLSVSPQPREYKPIKSFFDKLVAYGVSYGGFAVVVQIAYTFVFVGAPGRHYWMPFHVTAVKLFVIGVITLLNSRESTEPRASNKEDHTWGSSQLHSGSRTAAVHSGGAGTLSGGGVASGLEFNVKPPIVIEVAQSTEQDMDSVNGKRGYGIHGSDENVHGRVKAEY